MSLLANLLAFSSLNSSMEKQDRSASANSRFFGDEDNSPKNISVLAPVNNRTASKSLSKMNFYSGQKSSKIDPKHRSLQRVSHSFNMKIRKYYYQFFICLQTLKKTKQQQNQLTQSRKIDINNGLNKLSQTFSIIMAKQYQNSSKAQMWAKIRRYSHCQKFISSIDEVLMRKKRKICEKLLFQHFKDWDMMAMKAQILFTALQSLTRSEKYSSEHLKGMKCFFQQLKKLEINQQSAEKSFKEEIVIPNNLFSSPNRPRTHSSQKNTPTKFAKKVLGLLQSTHKQSLENYQQQVYKSYKVLTNYQEKPFPYSISIQSHPKMLGKQIPQELAGSSEIGDLCDKSNIFRQFKTHLKSQSQSCSQIDKLQIMSIVGQPFSRIGALISDLQKNKEQQGYNSSKSQITYTPFLPCQSSVSTIQHRNDSNFGSEAVSFKNSLVQERESMKNLPQNKDTPKHIFRKKNADIGSTTLNMNQLNSSLAVKKPKIKDTLAQKPQTQYLFMSQTNKIPKFAQFRSEDDLVMNYQQSTKKKVENEPPLSQYNSEGKTTKSFSFNSHDIVSRRLKFNEEFSAVRKIQEQEKKSKYDRGRQSQLNSMKGPISWKNQLLERKTTMLPVRDTQNKTYGDEIIRVQMGGNKEQREHLRTENHKKFINLSRKQK